MPRRLTVLLLSSLVIVALTGVVCTQMNARTEAGIQEMMIRGLEAGRNFAPPTQEKERKRIAKSLNAVIAANNYSSSTLSQWLEILADKESGNKARIKILDVNNRYSYGCLMFQMETWKGMGRAYGIGTTEENIYDCQLQKLLAYRMISDNYNNWHHWGYTVAVRMKVWPPKS